MNARATNARMADASTTLKQQAYQEIKRRILDAELAPGAPLSEYQLADLLEVSRTPIREALGQLETEGLVRSAPQRGAFVAELTMHDILEIYQVREALEGVTARVAAERMEPADVDELIEELARAREMAAQGSLREAFDSDTHLHKRIIRVTQNRRLEQILGTLDDQVHRIRYLSPRTPGRLQQTLDEHDDILRAIRDRRGDRAEAAMHHHLREARANALRLIGPAGLS